LGVIGRVGHHQRSREESGSGILSNFMPKETSYCNINSDLSRAALIFGLINGREIIPWNPTCNKKTRKSFCNTFIGIPSGHAISKDVEETLTQKRPENGLSYTLSTRRACWKVG